MQITFEDLNAFVLRLGVIAIVVIAITVTFIITKAYYYNVKKENKKLKAKISELYGEHLRNKNLKKASQ